MKIFVISLRSAQARRRHVVSEMAAAGIQFQFQFQFFDAVEAHAEPERHFMATSVPRYRINARRSPLPGEIACYASHLAVWRRCVGLGAPVIVLEDDFRLLPGFTSALPRLEALTREFGFVRIQSMQRGPRPFIGRPGLSPHKVRNVGEFAVYYLAEVPLCMLGYAVSPSAAAALIEGSECLKAPVDKFIQRTWEHGVPLFGIAPHIVETATISGDSTIGVRPRKSWNPLLLTLRSLDKIRGRIRRRAFNAIQLRRLGLDHSHSAGNRLVTDPARRY